MNVTSTRIKGATGIYVCHAMGVCAVVSKNRTKLNTLRISSGPPTSVFHTSFPDDAIATVVWDPTGRYLAVSFDSGCLRLFEPDASSCRTVLPGVGAAIGLVWMPTSHPVQMDGGPVSPESHSRPQQNRESRDKALYAELAALSTNSSKASGRSTSAVLPPSALSIALSSGLLGSSANSPVVAGAISRIGAFAQEVLPSDGGDSWGAPAARAASVPAGVLFACVNCPAGAGAMGSGDGNARNTSVTTHRSSTHGRNLLLRAYGGAGSAIFSLPLTLPSAAQPDDYAASAASSGLPSMAEAPPAAAVTSFVATSTLSCFALIDSTGAVSVATGESAARVAVRGGCPAAFLAAAEHSVRLATDAVAEAEKTFASLPGILSAAGIAVGSAAASSDSVDQPLTLPVLAELLLTGVSSAAVDMKLSRFLGPRSAPTVVSAVSTAIHTTLSLLETTARAGSCLVALTVGEILRTALLQRSEEQDTAPFNQPSPSEAARQKLVATVLRLERSARAATSSVGPALGEALRSREIDIINMLLWLTACAIQKGAADPEDTVLPPSHDQVAVGRLLLTGSVLCLDQLPKVTERTPPRAFADLQVAVEACFIALNDACNAALSQKAPLRLLPVCSVAPQWVADGCASENGGHYLALAPRYLPPFALCGIRADDIVSLPFLDNIEPPLDTEESVFPSVMDCIVVPRVISSALTTGWSLQLLLYTTELHPMLLPTLEDSSFADVCGEGATVLALSGVGATTPNSTTVGDGSIRLYVVAGGSLGVVFFALELPPCGTASDEDVNESGSVDDYEPPRQWTISSVLLSSAAPASPLPGALLSVSPRDVAVVSVPSLGAVFFVSLDREDMDDSEISPSGAANEMEME